MILDKVSSDSIEFPLDGGWVMVYASYVSVKMKIALKGLFWGRFPGEIIRFQSCCRFIRMLLPIYFSYDKLSFRVSVGNSEALVSIPHIRVLFSSQRQISLHIFSRLWSLLKWQFFWKEQFISKLKLFSGVKKKTCVLFIDNPDRSRSHDFSGEFETSENSESKKVRKSSNLVADFIGNNPYICRC